MAEYRVYTLGSDGHFTGFKPLLCDDDTQAIEKAKQILDGHESLDVERSPIRRAF
jgi:hypothetical protein